MSSVYNKNEDIDLAIPVHLEGAVCWLEQWAYCNSRPFNVSSWADGCMEMLHSLFSVIPFIESMTFSNLSQTNKANQLISSIFQCYN